MLVATHRQFTGDPVYRGYIRDTVTGTLVWGCPHRHKTIRTAKWDGNGRVVRQGGVFAQRCAERELRRRGDAAGPPMSGPPGCAND